MVLNALRYKHIWENTLVLSNMNLGLNAYIYTHTHTLIVCQNHAHDIEFQGKVLFAINQSCFEEKETKS